MQKKTVKFRTVRWVLSIFLVVGGLAATWAWGEVARLAEPAPAADTDVPLAQYTLWQPAEDPRPTLFRSYDGGATWQALDVPGAAALSTWAATPAAVDGGQAVAAALADGSLYVSRDGGDTWTVALEGPPILSLAWDASGGLYVGTAGSGVYRLVGGDALTSLPAGDAELDAGQVTHLAAAGGHLFATTPTYLFARDGATGAWIRSAPVYDGISALAVADPASIYIGTQVSGVWLTADAGQTWEPLDATGLGLAPGQMVSVTALAVDPTEPAMLYAAVDHIVGATQLYTSAAGTFVTVDRGASWDSLAGPSFPAARTAVDLVVAAERPLRVAAVTVEGPVSYLPDVAAARAALTSDGAAQRANAARVLGLAGDRAATDALLGALADPDPAVAMAAADALGLSGDRAVAGDLLVAIEHPNEGVRAGAARALGRLGIEAAVPRLREMLVNGSAAEVVAAAEGLARIGGQDAIEALLVPLGDVSLTPRRHAAMEGLESVGEPAVGPLVALLGDDATHVRYNAVEALGYIASPAASDALAHTLLRDASEAVRAEAARALGQIGGPVAREALASAAGRDASPLVQVAAEAAMDRAGRNSTGTAPWLVRLAEMLDGLQPVRWLVLSLSLAAAGLLLSRERSLLATVLRRVGD